MTGAPARMEIFARFFTHAACVSGQSRSHAVWQVAKSSSLSKCIDLPPVQNSHAHQMTIPTSTRRCELQSFDHRAQPVLRPASQHALEDFFDAPDLEAEVMKVSKSQDPKYEPQIVALLL